jgi:hypothetical protein
MLAAVGAKRLFPGPFGEGLVVEELPALGGVADSLDEGGGV